MPPNINPSQYAGYVLATYTPLADDGSGERQPLFTLFLVACAIILLRVVLLAPAGV